MKYNKLVRDIIPQIIKADGKKPEIHIANKEEYWQKLKEKLSEETQEFIEDENNEELADILEVIYAICEYKDVDLEQIEEIREEKKMKKGGFFDKIILEKINNLDS